MVCEGFRVLVALQQGIALPKCVTPCLTASLDCGAGAVASGVSERLPCCMALITSHPHRTCFR
jgi:hypothetical protein